MLDGVKRHLLQDTIGLFDIEACLARSGLRGTVAGAAGALALGADGTCERVAPPSDVAVVDTVGAGDAFAAVLIAGILKGWSIALTLERAQQLASTVCGLRGALPREVLFYQDFPTHWTNR